MNDREWNTESKVKLDPAKLMGVSQVSRAAPQAGEQSLTDMCRLLSKRGEVLPNAPR
jgi:hypothetical protein